MTAPDPDILGDASNGVLGTQAALMAAVEHFRAVAHSGQEKLLDEARLTAETALNNHLEALRLQVEALQVVTRWNWRIGR